MPAPASLAEKYRVHRAAFLLALELGCTPREAEAELRHRARREMRRETHFEDRRCAAAKIAPAGPATSIVGTVDDEPRQPWWKND